MKISSHSIFMLVKNIPAAFIFALIGSLLSGAVHSNPEPSKDAPNVSVTTNDIEKQIKELFSDFDSDDSPGCAVSVFKNGSPVYFEAFGLANLDYGISLSDSSAFYMASISKQVTAAAVGLLVLRGDLHLQNPVKNYIDDWPVWAEGVQVIHLLNHTSGLSDLYGLMDIAGISLSNVLRIDDYYEIIKNGEALKNEPGKSYSYTNSGYTVLAKLIQDISGSSFSEFVRNELLEPLSMNQTHFHESRHTIIPNRVVSYAPGHSGFRQTYLSNFQGVGPGGLYSTHKDWQKWDAFWHGDTDVTVEFSELREWMVQRAVIDEEPISYAMGLRVEEWMEEQVISHGGSFMGFKNDYQRYPGHRLSVLTLCNRQDAVPSEKNKEIARLFLAEHVENYIEPYTGSYHSEELDVTYTLADHNGQLVLERRLSPNGPITEESPGHWKAGSWDFEFQADDNGGITGFLLSTSRARNIEFEKVD